MTDADIIIKADSILTMDGDLHVVRDGAVAVKGGKIVSVGGEKDILAHYTSRTVIGGKGFIAFPGLVNTHTHSPMVYFRGLADDIPLRDWLEKSIWPAEQKWLSAEFVSDAVDLACIEMLKAGITLFNDMYFFGDEIAASAKRMGMRAVVGAGILDFPTKTAGSIEEYFLNAESLIKKWKGDDYITPCIAPHSAYTCGPETLKRAKRMSEKFGVMMHTHVSETQWEVGEITARYGKKPIEYLDSLRCLDESLLAAHCIWVEDSEIDLLARKKVGVSHCMESNLKLASGFAPVATMLSAGIKVTFGTDSAASNNDLNILGEMSTTAKVHKALANDPTVLDAKTVLLMATRWGAEALGLGNSCGSIEEGKSADIVLADMKKPHLTPMYDVYSHIVYSMNSADVSAVVVKGALLVKDGKLTAADEAAILDKAVSWGKRIQDG
jgi:5-methylthioadenosine/S-adenosylhomocysteine deaminase